jgi:hypothetical protein
MKKSKKPAGGSANEAKFQAVCARLAAIKDEGARYIEAKKAIAELNYEYPLGVIQKRVQQIIAENKKAAKTAATDKPEDVGRVVAEFNDEYGIVSINGDVKVVREFINKDGLQDFQLMTPYAFEIWTADHPKIVVQHGNKTVEKSAASVWLEHPDHRKCEGGLVFEPGVVEQPIAPGSKWPRYYNIWKGWGVEPSEEGSCELFKTHLLNVHCCGDKELYTHTWNHFAHMFQRPMEKPTTCNASIGDPGIGKSLVGDIIGKLAGDGYVPVTSDLLNGNFNGHMKCAIFVQADEATYAHDKKLAAKLKNNITCKVRAINDKGEKVFTVNAYDRYYFTAEKRDGLPVEKGDRRFAITEPLNAHAEDTAYFSAMMKQMKAGGYQRLMYELMHTDLAEFDCNKCPKTQARARAIQEVADVEVSFMIDMAMTLELWDYREDGFLKSETLIPCALLRDQFFKYAGSRRLNSRSTETRLGIEWAKAGIISGRKVTLTKETWINGKLLGYGDRVNAYKLPDPQEMRDKLIAERQLPADCFANGAKIQHQPKWEPPPPPIEPVDLPPIERRPGYAGRAKRNKGYAGRAERRKGAASRAGRGNGMDAAH